jgi:hypothetical protein
MVVTLPEQLQKEAEVLAHREGIDLETLVVRAVERFVREHRYSTTPAAEAHQRLVEHNKYGESRGDELGSNGRRKLTPRQGLRELSQHKLTDGGDFIAQVRLAKARAYQLYLDNEEWFDLSAQRIAESRQAFMDKHNTEE